MDGPKPFLKLYLLHAYNNCDNIYPCVFILFMKMTPGIYLEMLEHLKLIANKINVFLHPKLALIDLEEDEMQAFRLSFPGIELKCCFFQLRQAQVKWIFQHGYKTLYHNNASFRHWYRMIGALALIPPESINEGWALIKNQALDVNVAPIVSYFEKSWLNGVYQTTMWNHYGSAGLRCVDLDAKIIYFFYCSF